MRQFGLIGHPLGHSFSAQFFTEKFATEDLDARYDNFEMESVAQLRTWVESLPDLYGFNVTIPHKQTVMTQLDQLSPEAQEVGAVNVVSVSRNANGEIHLYGYNSDLYGFMESIRPLLFSSHRRALVLGTGGASKAVVVGLRHLGVHPVYVSRHASPPLLVGNEATRVLSYADINADIIHEHTLIVNASPVGMSPHTDEAPALPYDKLTPQHLLYDLIYNPLTTRFLQHGAARGCTIKNGLEMLHLQALEAWRIWNTCPT